MLSARGVLIMYIKIKVISNAKKELVKKINDNSYAISVREPAERNLANKRVCQIIAREMKVNEKQARIISGFHSPSKIISVNI